MRICLPKPRPPSGHAHSRSRGRAGHELRVSITERALQQGGAVPAQSAAVGPRRGQHQHSVRWSEAAPCDRSCAGTGAAGAQGAPAFSSSLREA